MAARVTAPAAVGFPCVMKPLMLSGSRGVMRADDPHDSLAVALRGSRACSPPPRVRRRDPAAAHILVESSSPGPEVALEGILTRGALQVLALFDKPDPLDGPTFEETIYVTPSRLPAARPAPDRATRWRRRRGARPGDGPVHAELRWCDAGRPHRS